MSKKVYVFSNDTFAGLKGRLMADLMNLMHKRVHAWLARRIGNDAKNVLDVGCGGGGLVRALCRRTGAKVTGIDYSPDMVRIAGARNQKAVRAGRVQLETASVSSLPFGDDTFNTVTAFETIQFWPDAAADLIEVRRVMKEGGALYIMNRLPKPSSKWYNVLPIKTVDDYKKVLAAARFDGADVDTKTKPGWIIVRAVK